MRVLHAIWSRLATSARLVFFFALVHVIFLRSVPARGRVTGAHVVSPVYRACAGMHACAWRAGAHPCLLSSSGSCPVELERRAQRRSASEDFILRGEKNTNRDFSTQEPCHFPTARRTQYFCTGTKTLAKQDTGAIFHKGIV